MMDIEDSIEKLIDLAKKDADVRARLLATKSEKYPISSFCKIGTDLGFPMNEMDLIALSEDSYAAIKRSTNGGGENSPVLEGEDDYYLMLLAQLS